MGKARNASNVLPKPFCSMSFAVIVTEGDGPSICARGISEPVTVTACIFVAWAASSPAAFPLIFTVLSPACSSFEALPDASLATVCQACADGASSSEATSRLKVFSFIRDNPYR